MESLDTFTCTLFLSFRLKDSVDCLHETLSNPIWCLHLHLQFTFTFSRRFYPKRLTLHSSYSLSALAFPGNRTHDLGVASAMLYHLSYRKATGTVYMCLCFSILGYANSLQ